MDQNSIGNSKDVLLKEKIRAFDPLVADILVEYCERLIDKNMHGLNIAETVLLTSIDQRCSDLDAIEKRELEGVIHSAKRILEGTPDKEWTEAHKELFMLLKKIVFVSLDDEKVTTDTDSINRVVDALMRLDYSESTPIFQVINEERNIYNYIGLILESIGQKFKESTVSAKAVNHYLSEDASKVLIITDEHWNIRFMSSSGTDLLKQSVYEVIGTNLCNYLPELNPLEIAKGLHREKWNFGKDKETAVLAYISVSLVDTDGTVNGEDEEVQELMFTIDLDTKSVENDEEAYNNLTSIDNVIQTVKSLKGADVKTSEFNYRLQSTLEGLYKLKYNQIDKLESPENKQMVEFIDPTILVKSILSEYTFHDGFSDMTFSIQNKKRRPFITDSETLYSILNHLIGNAIKYRNAEIDNQTVEIMIKDAEKGTIVEVKDNGIGMALFEVKNIFKKGYRINGDITATGYGLGLYFVKRCLDRCNGTIEVESKLGVGSIFRVTIPD